MEKIEKENFNIDIFNMDNMIDETDFSIHHQSSSPITPVTDLEREPILGADSNLRRHNSEFASKKMFFLDNDIQDNYIRSNSPISMSEYNSNSDNSDNENDNIIINKKAFKKKDFHDIELSLSKYYETEDKFANKLDIIITFIKGQKNVFMQSKYITQRKIHLLVIPTLLCSAAMAIFARIIQHYEWSGGLISALNALVASFIAILKYMKYESYSEKYLQLSTQYDRIEISLEMTNNKLVFMDEDKKNALLLEKMVEIEHKINDMKEIHTVLIPQEVIKLFPIICSINVFALIRKMENHKKLLLCKFTDVKNEIRYILHKWKNDEVDEKLIDLKHDKEKNRLLFLYDVKEKLKQELLECKSVYNSIDDIFTKEIKNTEGFQNFWTWIFSFFYYKKPVINKDNMSPILQKYFHFIFDA
jgi:hypothetical protein